MNAQRRLEAIIRSWYLNADIKDLYHIIIDWLSEYKDIIKNQDLVTEILNRMDTDDLKIIVHEFIHGERYAPIRLQFMNNDMCIQQTLCDR